MYRMERGVGNAVVMVAVTCLLHCEVCQMEDNEAEKFQEEAGQIYTTVFHKYKKNVRPPDFYPNPVPVEVNVTLIHIRGLDILKQELESIIDLEIKWQDKRLAWYANKVVMITEELSEVWHPSIVYINGALPPSPLFDSKVTISKDGMITWKRREIVTTVCPTLPHNTSQICDVSLGFTSPESVARFNETSFTLLADFSNHHWDILSVHIDSEDTRVVRFLLELNQLDPSQNGLGGKNCSEKAEAYSGSNGGACMFDVRRVLVMMVVVMCLLRGVLG